jgi:hypothetical protein
LEVRNETEASRTTEQNKKITRDDDCDWATATRRVEQNCEPRKCFGVRVGSARRGYGNCTENTIGNNGVIFFYLSALKITERISNKLTVLKKGGEDERTRDGTDNGRDERERGD